MNKSMKANQHRSFILILAIAFFFLLFLQSIAEARLTVKEPSKELILETQSYAEKWGCVICTFITGLIIQLKQLHNISANEARKMFCGFFPSNEALLCSLASLILIDKALPLIDGNKTADDVCLVLSYCNNDQCHLFPRNNNAFSTKYLQKKYKINNFKKVDICTFFPRLCKVINEQNPYYDDDNDLFSIYPTLRGSNWRGRDCDDKNSSIFPGRNTLDVIKDENCNGIYGIDNITGKTYEELWCSNSGSMGVIALGDSVTAHFGLPADFVTVRELSSEVMKNFSNIIENEIDWPMLSSITGFTNASNYKPNKEGPMTSFYSELLKRNRCNHRDFQNLGVNGATTARLSELMNYVARNRTQIVKPVFMFISMIGNDVCDPPPGITSPIEYYNNIIKTLEKANLNLPNGSHVLISPIADGRILYNTMHNRIHPIGSLNNDVTYANFYDFLNCVEISPCWGWLNTNETIRNETWESAKLLNAQISHILKESSLKFKNITVHAFDDIITGALSLYKGPLWEVIEPVDGFHPSQRGSALIGEYLFNKTLEMGIIPPINPFNEAIIDRFGDQGGY